MAQRARRREQAGAEARHCKHEFVDRRQDVAAGNGTPPIGHLHNSGAQAFCQSTSTTRRHRRRLRGGLQSSPQRALGVRGALPVGGRCNPGQVSFWFEGGQAPEARIRMVGWKVAGRHGRRRVQAHARLHSCTGTSRRTEARAISSSGES